MQRAEGKDQRDENMSPTTTMGMLMNKLPVWHGSRFIHPDLSPELVHVWS